MSVCSKVPKWEGGLQNTTPEEFWNKVQIGELFHVAGAAIMRVTLPRQSGDDQAARMYDDVIVKMVEAGRDVLQEVCWL